ncbi:MAG: LLM class F420-dependent oxidoreductase [Lapillicoccus sp.]
MGAGDVRLMLVDVQLPVQAGTTADPRWVTRFAQHAERCGFDGLVAVEHTVVGRDYAAVYPYASDGLMGLPVDCPIPDPLELLAFLAAVTTRVTLATGVLVLPNHHPVVLAKRVATLDVLSGGRVRLGVGVGWMAEEVEACGANFATRGRRVDETIDVLRALWSDRTHEGVSHAGEFFRFVDVVSAPVPQQTGGVPIHIGGHSRAAALRAGRRGDGLQPLGVAAADLPALVSLMRAAARAAGRDPAALELTLGHSVEAVTPERLSRLKGLGATRVVLKTTPTIDVEAACAAVSSCAERLGLPVRQAL